jgi:RNA-directed DNA polymerase
MSSLCYCCGFNLAKIKPASEFRRHFAEPFLAETYKARVRNTRTIGLDRVDMRNFDGQSNSEIALISKKVLASTYQFTKYKEKLILKGAGKAPRQLSIPTIRDRLALRALCDFLFAVFPESRPVLPQQTIEALCAAVDSGAHKSFIKIDLAEFYPSLRHDLLLAKLRKRARLPQFVQLVLGALRNETVTESGASVAHHGKKGVAQGLSISNVLAEIFMLDADTRMKSIAPDYFRYVDDIVVLTSADPAAKCHELCKILKQLKLNPHALGASGSKTQTGELADGFDFLGYSIKPGSVSIRRSSVIGFEASLVEAFTEYKHRLRVVKSASERDVALARFRWALNLKLTGCIYKEQRYGWVFYYSQISDLRVLRRIDNTVNLLVKRFKVVTPPRPKRTLKAFYESKRVNKATHRYIPNYDTMTTADMRTFLEQIGFNVSGLPDDEVIIAFNKVLRRATRKLEKDISNLS